MDRCDPIRGCVCMPGWTGTNCNQDIDECSANRSICGTDKICHNTQGSFQCECRQGYQKVQDDCRGKYVIEIVCTNKTVKKYMCTVILFFRITIIFILL